MLRRVGVALAASALVVSGCGAQEDDAAAPTPAASESRGAAAPDPVPSADAGGDAGGDAEAYAKVVMSTNLQDVFSGYEIDGTEVTFLLVPGTNLDEAQCQYLRLSNRALRESAGITVVVDDNGTEQEC